MAKINILDSTIYNRISAGEVVDRPYSVVKEFVENSIDAGAQNITVRIVRGGKESICVSDDGCGIENDDFRSAFLPHATSKIALVEDLDVIQTLGFRGEALASIASVANVTLQSRAEGGDCAYRIACNGGVLGELLPCARDRGTEISAENLFFNTPVRAKFLKSDKGEEAEITNFVSRFVLGNPDVAFCYYINGKLSLQSFGEGMEEAVVAVYGAQVLRECYRIDAKKHGITIRGFVGKPSFTKANRTYQSTFVNGRLVTNTTISSAIANAYGGYLMKRQYPFYILFIDVPPEVVDVNVHPNKADVRFENNQVIYGSIYSVISAVLDGNAGALEYIVNDPKIIQNQDFSLKKSTVSDIKSVKTVDFKETTFNIEKSASTSDNVKSPLPKEYYKDYRVQENDRFDLHDSAFESAVKMRAQTSTESAPPISDIFEENKHLVLAAERKMQQQKIIFERSVYRGCLFNTYLLYELGDDCFMIDQHAAHERLLFDRFKNKVETGTIVKQPMLIPYVFKVNAEEAAFLQEKQEILEEIGFECELFGNNSFKVSTVPMELQDVSLTEFFDEVLKSVGTFKGIRLHELLREKLAMAACKHAVKGGMALSNSEQEKLFEMLGGNFGLKCPHGRPIAIKLSRNEIEKMFKRIV